ncbi:MAG: hypothetical protein WBC06_17435, partial [Chitinophagaceae bacterium]
GPAGQDKKLGLKSTSMDSATYNLLSTVIKMIQVAEDPKKGQAFLTATPLETNLLGQQYYTAPYSFSGLPSSLIKESTDRAMGTTTWEWEAVYTTLPKNSGDEIGKMLGQRTDSLLHLLKYRKSSGPNTVLSSFAYFSKYSEPKGVKVFLKFLKGVTNTAQQAYDSLLAIYKPLLFKPAFAYQAASKFGYALQQEGFDKSKMTACFKDLVMEVANTNTEAAFQILTGVPDFIDFKSLYEQLPADKSNAVKAWAKKAVDKFYEEERLKVGGKPVEEQKKKVETDKALAGCPGISDNQKYKYQLGITMAGTVNSQPFIGRLTSIDCRNGKVTITKPGKRIAFDYPLDLRFGLYEMWQKHDKQFYRCTLCGGEGGEMVTTSETKTKELPQGYFSGIETKVTRTKKNTSWDECYKCLGTGWALEPDRNPGYN